MKAAFMEPPYTFEFDPLTEPMVVVIALQFKHSKSLTCIVTPLAVVSPHVLLLFAEALLVMKLQECAPTYRTLSDPPYELAPFENPLPLVEVTALQEKHDELMTWIDAALADVCAHVLLPPKLQE